MTVAYFDVAEPIPGMDAFRKRKQEYRDWPFTGNLSDELLVDLADVGIRGQSFYSQPRPTDVDQEPVAGVNPQALVRLTVADKLVAANQFFMTNDAIARVFDSHVELIVRDAYRSRELQQYLFDEIAPLRLRREHPDWTDEQIMVARPSVFAEPLPDSPSPHATGGAIDVTLVRLGDDGMVNFGFKSGREYSGLRIPECHESFNPSLEIEPEIAREARDNRRALFWTMRRFGFAPNPDEWWHFNFGNQMWAWFESYATELLYGSLLGYTFKAIYGEVNGAPDWIRPDAI